MLPTKHKKNYLLFGSGSSNLYSFDFSMPEKSSDQLCYQTKKKKAFSAHGEAANGPEISGDALTVIENYPIT